MLHLLTSPDAVTPYRIAASATMLPNSTVRRFDPLPQGSRLLTDGTGLAVAPTALRHAVRRVAVLPGTDRGRPRVHGRPVRRTGPPERHHAGRVGRGAVRLHPAPRGRAGQHLRGGSRQPAERSSSRVLKRTDTFTVKKGQSLTAPKEFTALVPGRTRITSRATMTTLEFVVFGVPANSGDATLVAASEQLVSAAGS